MDRTPDDLAEWLGYARSDNLLRLIDRKRGELLCFGPLLRAKDGLEVFRQIDGKPSGVCPQATDKLRDGRGRPRTPYLLNEGQAVLTSLLSNAPNAPAVRHQVVSVFLAWRSGRLAPRGPLANLEAMAPSETVTEIDLAGRLGLAHPAEMRALVRHPLTRVARQSGCEGRGDQDENGSVAAAG